MSRHTLVLAVALLSAAGHALAGAAPYRLDWLGHDFFPFAINDRGQVIGTDLRGQGLGPALVWENGVFRELAAGQGNDINNDGVAVLGVPSTGTGYLSSAVLTPAGLRTDLPVRGWGGDFRHQYSINIHGHVVGMEKFATSSDGRAFIWDGRTITYLSLGVPTGFSSAHAINDADQVVGWWSGVEPGSGGGGFLWHSSGTTFLPSPALSINSRGEVVLLSGSVWHEGNLTPIPTLPILPVSDPKTLRLDAREINDLGQVVGTSEEMYLIDVESGYGLIQRGFLWDPIVGLVDLNAVMGVDPSEFRDLPLSRPMDINDGGQIVGYGPLGGWLLTPIPEPGTAVLLLPAAFLATLRLRPARAEPSPTRISAIP